jgi:hypothetical protein
VNSVPYTGMTYWPGMNQQHAVEFLAAAVRRALIDRSIVPFLGGVPRRYAIGHRLFIEYGEMRRDLIRICRQPPKAVSLLRAMSRECLRANRKRQIQKPVSQVRILPGALCDVSGHRNSSEPNRFRD